MRKDNTRVGEVRPSQLMHTYGVGAIVDLPRISVIVTGLEDWKIDPQYTRPIVEERLLQAVRYWLPQVKQLLSPPIVSEQGSSPNPFDDATVNVGVPVAAFPRWMVCPQCRLLAPLSSGLFELKPNFYQPDRTAYLHANCNKSRKPPEAIPARFLVVCEAGHLDDFPWVEFVHQELSCASPLLRLIEYGTSGEARDLEVKCDTCGKGRRLSEAFGEENRKKMPRCKGRRPHLRDYDPTGCANNMRTIILGASNTWFPVVLSTVAIPVDEGKLEQLVKDNWAKFQAVNSPEIIPYLRSIGQLSGGLADYQDRQIWQVIEKLRQKDQEPDRDSGEQPDLKEPEWQVFIEGRAEINSRDFRLQRVSPPQGYETFFESVVLVERLREVRAMIGFTRVDALGELSDPEFQVRGDLSPLSRRSPTWLPADEVRGEGIFIRFKEPRVQEWSARPAVESQEAAFREAHKKWRQMRRIEPADGGFPGMRYVLIHTFAHALMRQLALECGYAAASIRERLYVRSPEKDGGPMAGLLIYTSAPDSEGTLGGLVSLGQPGVLGRLIGQALEAARLCASDPLCAEQPPDQRGQTVHAAACHACVFAPETSCERGNRYLDRSTLIKTVGRDVLAFFE